MLDLVAKARQLLQHDSDIDDDNATILNGRCEYILSRLYTDTYSSMIKLRSTLLKRHIYYSG